MTTEHEEDTYSGHYQDVPVKNLNHSQYLSFKAYLIPRSKLRIGTKGTIIRIK
jgi:hypothetical protein